MIEIQWWVNGYASPQFMKVLTPEQLFSYADVMSPALVRTREEMEYLHGLQLVMGRSLIVYCYADAILCDEPIRTQLAVVGLDE